MIYIYDFTTALAFSIVKYIPIHIQHYATFFFFNRRYNTWCVLTCDMQRYTILLCMETPLYISGGNFTHHQECIHLYLQHLVFFRPLMLPAASGR